MGNNNSNDNSNNNVDNNENNQQNKIPSKIIKDQRELIYKGEYSEIYKSINDNKGDTALKIINKEIISKLIINDIDITKYIEEKISLMKEISSKTEYSVKIVSDSLKNDKYFIEMEYYSLNLRQYFQKHYKDKAIDLNLIKDIFKKLNNVLILMEEKNIYHGNIKPNHILIIEKDQKNIIPILTDYFQFNSFSKKFDFYIAPEILTNKNNPSENKEISIKSDLWSIGIILYELYFSSFPYQTKEEYIDIIKNKKSLTLRKSEKDLNFNDLITNLLIIDNKDRISFQDYINHKFWKDDLLQKFEEQNLIKENKNVNKTNDNNENNKLPNEFNFKFKTDNYRKELYDFSNNDLKDVEIFKFSEYKSKKSELDDKIIIQWIKNLNFQNLKKLYLNGNNITNIEGLRELVLEKLTHFYLNSNKIYDLTELNKVQFKNLILLDLSQNNITNIDSLSDVKFKSLSILNLSENKISNILPLKNLHLKDLKILNLGFNQIQKIEVLSQVDFIYLKSLYLNNNKIINIDVFNSTHFVKLENLFLNNNNISNINSIKNSKLSSLKKLDLSFNKINSIEIIKSHIFDNLESLNISFNKLDNIDVFEELKLKSIKKICFYGNDIINLDSLYVKEIINELKNKHINII